MRGKPTRGRKKTQDGFTLVELIVVIAIIGIVASLLVPAIIGYIKDAQFSAANANAKAVYNAVNRFAERCSARSIKITYDDHSATSVLIVGDSDEEPDFSAITEVPLEGAGITDEGLNELQKEVNTTLAGDAEGTYYLVVLGKNNFPEAVYWSTGADNKIVGKYPAPSDNRESSAGIVGISWYDGEEHGFGDD